MESILTSIKKQIGLTEEDTSFDDNLIFFINSAFAVLNDEGVGPQNGFRISGKEETWNLLEGTPGYRPYLQEYMYIQAKLKFDPPQSSTLLELLQQQKQELEWRLYT